MLGVPQAGVTVYGKNFTLKAEVLVDGAPVQTIFHDSGTLEVNLGLSLFSAPGMHLFSVSDATGSSNSLTWTVYAPAQGPQPFLAIPGYFVGAETDPSAIVVADVDGDGLADVILPGPPQGNNPTLAILKGQRDGTLAPPRYLVGFAATALVAGDVNGDGATDLIAALFTSPPSSTFQVLLNDGKGNFTPASNGTIAGVFPGPVVLADMDRDGRPDLLISTKDPNSIYLLRNLGGGSFGPPQTLATTSINDRSFSVADFNGDGRPDIVYTATNSTTGADEIHLLLNQSNGTFSDVAPSSLAGVVGFVTVGDFNLDGLPDLAIQSGSPSFPITLSAFLNQGNATFAQASNSTIAPAGFEPYRLVVGDFDHDGHPDLAGANGETEPSHILYLWGDGRGNFTPQQVNGPQGFLAASGDFNGDGLPDVVVPDRFNEVSVALGRTDRNYPSPESLAPDAAGSVSAADVNGDGLLDLFFVGDAILGTPGTVFLNRGIGNFQLAGRTPPNGLLIADLNGDGFADLVGFNGSDILIWPGTGNPNFPSLPITIVPPVGMAGLEVVDIDKDGHPDLVAPGVILYGRGNFQFDAVQVPFQGPFAVGDFNNDGFLDIASPAVTLLGGPNRTFKLVPSNLNMTSGNIAVVADFNGDGFVDIAFSNDPFVEIAYGRGDGTFYLQSALTAGQRIGGMVAGDFNGDGRPDIVTALMFAQQLVLYTNDGQGGFLRSYFASGADAVGLISADFNKDGKPDLAILNFGLSFRPPNALVMFSK